MKIMKYKVYLMVYNVNIYLVYQIYILIFKKYKYIKLWFL